MNPAEADFPPGMVLRENPLNGWRAHFSDCGRYRYTLEIPIQDEGPLGVFLMLNPSTATELGPDPTVRRCMRFAEREGWGTLMVLNAYALRSTDPAGLWAVEDPVGPLNDECILAATWFAGEVVCAWGVNATRERSDLLRAILFRVGVEPKALGHTKAGAPRHPLYVRSDAPLEPLSQEWGVPR